MNAWRRFVGAAGLLAAACGDGDDRSYDVRFRAVVGAEPFACNRTFAGLGTTGTTMTPLDFRLYVHGVALVRRTGERVPLALEQDGRWQRGELALLDFEDGLGGCTTGSPELRTIVRGTAPAHDDYAALELRIGVPKTMNHLDAPVAEPPLNIPGLWWSWKGGYKYVRLDVQTPMNPSYFFHHGATGCEGELGAFTCQLDNVDTIRLDGFDPATKTVVLDVKALYADVDLDRKIDNKTDFIAGCMASAGDPECPPMFARMGLRFPEGGVSPATQTFLRVE